MVQVRPRIYDNDEFQFLNGAIGVKKFFRQNPNFGIFQFLNGAIGVLHSPEQILKYLLFQFLNGAIGVTQICLLLHICGVFQFLNGAIGVADAEDISVFRLYFNSLMVRLE